MMSAMNRRLIARALRLLLLVCLLGLVLAVAALVADDAPAPDPATGASAAAEAFEAAYETLTEDFEAAAALAPGRTATLAELTASIRAVRLAYSDFDTTVAAIPMPPGAVAGVTAMHAAIEDLVVKFDLQGATTTVPAYQDANPEAAAAFKAAGAAIAQVRATLQTLSTPPVAPDAGSPVALPTPGSRQAPVTPSYVRGARIVSAAAWRDDLLRIGIANADTRYVDDESFGISAGWAAAFPEILTGAALVRAEAEAPRNGISGVVVRLPDPSRQAARDNAPYLAFAVRGDGGSCAGGVISGFPALTTSTPVDVAPGQVCTGLAVAAAAGFENG